jgi:hypothetical protein
LCAKHPTDGKEWLLFDIFLSWEMNLPLEEERFEFPRKNIRYSIKSAIVQSDKIDDIFRWAKNKPIWNWIDYPKDLYEVFFGEYYWSPVYRYFRDEGWNIIDNDEISFKYYFTSDGYVRNDSTYDCSIEESIRVLVPSWELYKQLNLIWTGDEGVFHNSNKDIVVFDPSIFETGPESLLVSKEEILKYLNKNSYTVIWEIIGEKLLIGGDYQREDNYPGRLQIYGSYYMGGDGKIKGDWKTECVT